jgi:flagellar protein FliT
MSRMLIECYRSIQESSEKMLVAAQSEQWEQVAHQEGVCAVLIAELRERARSEELQPGEQSEKQRIMRSILVNDAKVRAFAEPWVELLGRSQICEDRRVLH